MKFSRTRLLTLLLVAVFSFAAVGATTIASATDATTAAKKKKKKCKKGYKKSGKKCKKKTSPVVKSVTLKIDDISIYGITVSGTVTTKTPQTTISVNIDTKLDTKSQSESVAATSAVASTTLTFTTKVRNLKVNAPPYLRFKAQTMQAFADGVPSNIVKYPTNGK